MKIARAVLRRALPAALGVLPISAASAQDPLARLGWMAGCWEARSGERTTFEMWSPPAGGVMVGGGRTVKGGAAQSFERLLLTIDAGTPVYTAIPSGQREGSFRATVASDSMLQVENPAHDFPTRITYRRVGGDSLVATVEGPGPDGMQGFTVRYARVRCHD